MNEIREQIVELRDKTAGAGIHFVLRDRAADTIERLERNLMALHIYVATGGVDLNEFAEQFPRTWNAIVTGKPATFDLPDAVGG